MGVPGTVDIPEGIGPSYSIRTAFDSNHFTKMFFKKIMEMGIHCKCKDLYTLF